MPDQDDLARSLRAWRDRLDPGQVGLPSGRLRRAPGLRREELAGLVGVSVDYLARLEQGRATNPSPSVLGSLARALRLSDAERDHLYRRAGHAPPDPGHIDRHITPGIQRILDRLEHVPALVIDPATTVIAFNRLAEALMGDFGTDDDTLLRNMPRRHFLGGPPSRVVRSAEETAQFEASLVAQLHLASGQYPADPCTASLIDDLLAGSERFRALWSERPVVPHFTDRKTYDHPEVGLVTVDCDALSVNGSHLRVLAYTAPRGSRDADALQLLGAIGVQQFG